MVKHYEPALEDFCMVHLCSKKMGVKFWHKIHHENYLRNLWSISKHILNILGFKKDWTFLSKNMGTWVPSMCFLRTDNWIIRHGPHKTSQQKLMKASEMKGLGYTLQKANDCLLLLCEPLLKQASCSLPWPSLSVSWESHFTMFKYAQTDFLGKQ